MKIIPGKDEREMNCRGAGGRSGRPAKRRRSSERRRKKIVIFGTLQRFGKWRIMVTESPKRPNNPVQVF
jgi:hypothetical protein